MAVIKMIHGQVDDSTDQPGTDEDKPLIDPAWFDTPEMRQILTDRDVGALYRTLKDLGISQRQIARRTRQAQSEVSAILSGRQVRDVMVLERIADGLGIPRGHLRLSGGDPGPDAYAGQKSGTEPEVDEEMRRRALIATTSLAALGQVVQGLGELTELALPTEEPLPTRLSTAHVRAMRAITDQLREMARRSGGQAGLFAVAARYYTRWLSVPADDAVQAQLGAALAELHTEAGWCCYDSGVNGTGHFARALRLADQVGDGFGIANAAFHTGRTLVHSGHANDALKAFQLGQCVLDGFQPGKATPATLRADDPGLPTLIARLNRSTATAYALLGNFDQAKLHLVKAYNGWEPKNAYDRGVMDHATGVVQLDLRRLDAAQQCAASAVRVLGNDHGRIRASAQLLLAEVHVRTEDGRGLALAQQAIEAVSASQSVAVRRERLDPLIAALAARPGSDARELALTARRIAADKP